MGLAPALLVLVVWVWRHARREMHSWAGVWLLNPVWSFLVLFASAARTREVSQTTAPAVAMRGSALRCRTVPAPLECHGSRGPTVILEPGAGGSAASMGLIAPAVARDSRVCVYDRAGRGWSDPAASPPDGAQIATDLHTLLSRARVPGPYVLAGHSFGGLYVRTYAAKYPEQVAGLVLVDSTAADIKPVSQPKAGSYSVLKHVSSLVATTSRLGLGRLLADTSFSIYRQSTGRCPRHRRHPEGNERGAR